MEFKIPCDTITRFANILVFKDNEYRDYIKSFLIEIKNGTIYFIASNSRVLAVERVAYGLNNVKDGVFHMTIDPVLLEACAKEVQFSGNLQIVYNEMLDFAAAKTTFGYNYPKNAFVKFDVKPEDNRLQNWRNILPGPVTASRGAMMVLNEHFQALGKCAPSGYLVFPEFIDEDVPVVIRDKIDSDWFGFFFPRTVDENGKLNSATPATIPEWV